MPFVISWWLFARRTCRLGVLPGVLSSSLSSLLHPMGNEIARQVLLEFRVS